MIRIAMTMMVLAATPALAQEAGNGRFSMSPTAEGYLKLDSRTGDVTECRRSADQGYRCTLTPDERSALQAEIDRLAADNASLRARLAGGGGPLPPAGGTGPGVATPPTDQDIDRAMGIMERFMRRFMALMREEQAKPPSNP